MHIPQHSPDSNQPALPVSIENNPKPTVESTRLFPPPTFDSLEGRSAGILMHITCLPSAFGIGDMGEAAFRFADHLSAGGQRWWQMLPVGPVTADQFYSPYSSWSVMAGNPLLICPEILATEGLLTREELREHTVAPSEKIDYSAVIFHKGKLLMKAYSRAESTDIEPFQRFCHEEKHWLDDVVLFAVLRNNQNGKPWNKWKKAYKQRDTDALKTFFRANSRSIRYEQWKQYQFYRQWERLKKYCHQLGIHLLGDIPVYAGYDSVDVWANRRLFALNENGSVLSVAGVPPDYFNSRGQLWGMPVFDWQAHQMEGYSWWIRRIASALRLFDKIRLDHFRAFSSYWEVPARRKSAVHGRWMKGPGKDFFVKVTEALGTMPFVAEDLGEIDERVHHLRKSLGLPGMKVLQFAFGDAPGQSPHAPHHHEKDFLVYTGTHDNNTTQGWFNTELNRTAREKLDSYCGTRVTRRNVNQVMIRLAYASVARTVIIPMQDILELDEGARMNCPGTTTGNWLWRMSGENFTDEITRRLLYLTRLYGR